MKKLKGIAIILFANVLVFAVLLEIGSNLFFFMQNGSLFYTRERTKVQDTEREQNPFMSGALHGVIHPYFGFVYKANPGGQAQLGHVKLNNHGFMFNSKYAATEPGCCDFPSKRSFAASLAYDMQEYSALTDAIRAIPRFANRRIRILPLALGGHKQPQQLMILAYYLALGQPLDVIVNVD